MASRPPYRRNGARGRPDEQLRLMTKVARLYHEHGVRQPEIARRLHISQARVSRLLKQAEQEGIVRTTVVVPEGVQTGLEDALEEAYGLREAVVVESMDTTDDGVIYDLGVAAAAYLELTLTGGDIVGMSSWSATLLAAVDAMRPLSRTGAERVVQLMGGAGNPSAEAHAARLTQRFADLTGAEPTFLLAPGIASSTEARDVLLKEPVVREAMAAMDDGHARPRRHRLTRAFDRCCRAAATSSRTKERRVLGKRGAVGDICLRLIDADGKPVASDVDKRVIGMTLEQLRRTRPLRRGRGRSAQVRGDPCRAARALGQRADHRSRHRRAVDRRPPRPHAGRSRRSPPLPGLASLSAAFEPAAGLTRPRVRSLHSRLSMHSAVNCYSSDRIESMLVADARAAAEYAELRSTLRDGRRADSRRPRWRRWPPTCAARSSR